MQEAALNRKVFPKVSLTGRAYTSAANPKRRPISDLCACAKFPGWGNGIGEGCARNKDPGAGNRQRGLCRTCAAGTCTPGHHQREGMCFYNMPEEMLTASCDVVPATTLESMELAERHAMKKAFFKWACNEELLGPTHVDGGVAKERARTWWEENAANPSPQKKARYE